MEFIEQAKTCCFFGHRKVDECEALKNDLLKIIESLIVKEKVDIFLFGSKSEFDSLCLKIVSILKEKYPHIKRIYVRCAYKNIDESYRNYLLRIYDDTYYPTHIENSGKASYVERNREMINHSKFCVIYYNKNYLPPRRKKSTSDLSCYQPKSGTAIARNYAVARKRIIINTFK